jgi:precorrin-6B methylase 2
MELFEFYAAHPEESEIHDQAMRVISAAHIRAVLLEAFDFAQAGTLVDVGGGTGELLAAILADNPSLRGILFDMPHVVAQATPVLTDHKVVDRVKVIGGSFFETVPTGGNTYLMKSVLHDWDDARSMTILRNCRKAMRSRDRLIILDRRLPELGQPGTPETFLVDLEMLVMTDGGWERTREEFAKLLTDTGFTLAKTVSTKSPLSIFEASSWPSSRHARPMDR